MNVGVMCLDARGLYIPLFHHNQLAPIVAGFEGQKYKFILGPNSVDEFKIVFPEYKDKVFPWKRPQAARDIAEVAKSASLNLIIVGGYTTFRHFMPICDRLVIIRSLDNRDGKVVDNIEFWHWSIESVEGIIQQADNNNMWRVSHLFKKKPKLLGGRKR